MPRDELAEALWEDAPPPTWEKALSVIVSKLRGLLADAGVDGANVLTSAFGCYRLDLPEGSWVDVIVAANAAQEAEDALAAGDLEQAKTAAALAASMARQPFLPGEDGAWVEEKRRELADVRGRALSALAEACLRSGDAAEAAKWAEQAIALAPFREVGYRRLMEAHAAAGNRAEALQVYERCRRLLAEELGAYPSPETESIYRGLLEAPAPPAGAATRPRRRRRRSISSRSREHRRAARRAESAGGGSWSGSPARAIAVAAAPSRRSCCSRAESQDARPPPASPPTRSGSSTPATAARAGRSRWGRRRARVTAGERLDLGHERRRRHRLADRPRNAGRRPDDPGRQRPERDRDRRRRRLGGEQPRRHRLADRPGDEHASCRRSTSETVPLGIAYAAGSIWVANTGDDTITRIDADSGKPTKTLPIAATELAFGAGTLWASESDGEPGGAHRPDDGKRRAGDPGRERPDGNRLRQRRRLGREQPGRNRLADRSGDELGRGDRSRPETARPRSPSTRAASG